MSALVGVLWEQDAAGSQLIGILKGRHQFSSMYLETPHDGKRHHQFSPMYRAHADREDMVLFPLLTG